MMEQELTIDDKVYKLEIEHKDGRYHINIDSRNYIIDYTSISNNRFSLLIDNKAITVYHSEANGKKYLSIEGEQFCIEETKAGSIHAGGTDSTGLKEDPIVCSPMPGKVVKISVKVGDEVEKGQGLVIVEAMKMENEIKSPMKGRIGKVNFKEGDLVDARQAIIEIKPENEK